MTIVPQPVATASTDGNDTVDTLDTDIHAKGQGKAVLEFLLSQATDPLPLKKKQGKNPCGAGISDPPWLASKKTQSVVVRNEVMITPLPANGNTFVSVDTMETNGQASISQGRAAVQSCLLQTASPFSLKEAKGKDTGWPGITDLCMMGTAQTNRSTIGRNKITATDGQATVDTFDTCGHAQGQGKEMVVVADGGSMLDSVDTSADKERKVLGQGRTELEGLPMQVAVPLPREGKNKKRTYNESVADVPTKVRRIA
mmetsp:Transcript_17680/g.26993  ORF Transcript_17680/g.26993 Transcript_17680/m.26993 type:complete len:256 (+) Transcript_17680:2683-3450(+)